MTGSKASRSLSINRVWPIQRVDSCAIFAMLQSMEILFCAGWRWDTRCMEMRNAGGSSGWRAPWESLVDERLTNTFFHPRKALDSTIGIPFQDLPVIHLSSTMILREIYPPISGKVWNMKFFKNVKISSF